MSDLWYVAFGLLTLLVLFNSLFLVAAMRQVGVLHQRIRPTGPGRYEGPPVGGLIPELAWHPVVLPPDETPAPIRVYGYVAPGCGLCPELAAVMRAFARTRPQELMDVALVTEVGVDQAEKWAAEHDVELPLLQYPGALRQHEVPGTPFVVAVTSDDQPGKERVLATGVVNTLEQLEHLASQAGDNHMAFRSQGALVMQEPMQPPPDEVATASNGKSISLPLPAGGADSNPGAGNTSH